jgi:hypothetical protein
MKRFGCVMAGVSALLITSGGAWAQTPLTDEELAQARGGFITAQGVTFDFGAVVRTFDDGKLALQTQVVWTADGAKLVQAPDGVTAAGGASFVHQLVNGQLANVLINSDSNRNLRQETDVTLVLPAFGAFQADAARNLAGLRIGDDIAAAAVRAVGD